MLILCHLVDLVSSITQFQCRKLPRVSERSLQLESYQLIWNFSYRMHVRILNETYSIAYSILGLGEACSRNKARKITGRERKKEIFLIIIWKVKCYKLCTFDVSQGGLPVEIRIWNGYFINSRSNLANLGHSGVPMEGKVLCHVQSSDYMISDYTYVECFIISVQHQRQLWCNNV